MGGSAMSAGAIADAAAAARAYLRLEEGDEAALLATLAASAIGIGEAYCRTPFVIRGHEDVLSAERAWQRLQTAPVTAILAAAAIQATGARVAMPPESYGFDIDPDGVGWVRVLDGGGACRIAVTYEAGLAADWAGVPAPVSQGVTMLIAHLFGARSTDAAPPAAVAALWRPFRRLMLRRETRA